MVECVYMHKNPNSDEALSFLSDGRFAILNTDTDTVVQSYVL